MLTIASFETPLSPAVTPRTASGPILPTELSGVTVTVNGIAAGLRSVDSNQITFVTPVFLASTTSGTGYDVVIDNNGTITRARITIVPARPDIFNTAGTPTAGGRAKVLNVTNRVFTHEPFVAHTIKVKGPVRVETVLRVFLTGVANTSAAVVSVRIGSLNIPSTRVLTGGTLVEPGVYTIDFTLPPEANGLGDQPIIVTVTANGVSFSSRLDDTAARIRIL
jgi:uncharacterized protein (TIGR03437 family)